MTISFRFLVTLADPPNSCASPKCGGEVGVWVGGVGDRSDDVVGADQCDELLTVEEGGQGRDVPVDHGSPSVSAVSRAAGW
jgi:hypothetical protein